MSTMDDMKAQIDQLIAGSDNAKEGIVATIRDVARLLYSSDILLYNTILHYQFENNIINRYTPRLPPAGYPQGDIELGPFYYWLTNDEPPSSWQPEYKLLWGLLQFIIREEMGPSNISATLYAQLQTYISTTGFPASDGTLIGKDMYQQLDIHWLEAAIHYLYYKMNPAGIAKFNDTTATPIPLTGVKAGQVRIAIIGDWGTGKYDPAKTYANQPAGATGPALAVMAAVQKLKPDYIIHLGDVYYAGTDDRAILSPDEEQHNLVNIWSAYPGKTNFTLNSNHEMYDGGNGYFHVALSSGLFPLQKERSFFALEFANWVILGLDSAYYCDNNNLYMSGRIIDATQKQLLNKYKGNNRNVILLSHHNAISFDGTKLNPLWVDVTSPDALAGAPAYWYWGHLHEGIAYSNRSATGPGTRARCVGHGAVPNGEAWGLLDSSGKTIPTVDYFANTPVDPTGKTSARVFNGFAMLTLEKNTLHEDFYELDSSGGAVLKWHQ